VLDQNRTFAVASDEYLVELISKARHRLVIIAPALTELVAAAISDRLKDLDRLTISVTLDADPHRSRLLRAR
jgi:hypothetical protein